MENGLTKYETALGSVELSPEIVTKYLTRGNASLTEQEIKMFIELCKYQKLNPFTGEAYAIKFNTNFQMVVGYETYKRRADNNPEYIGRKAGIVVQRGNDIYSYKMKGIGKRIRIDFDLDRNMDADVLVLDL